DFVGSPTAMGNLYKWAQGRFPYVEPWSLSKNHVHISFQHQGSSTVAGSSRGGNIPTSGTDPSQLSQTGTGLGNSAQQELAKAGCGTMIVLGGIMGTAIVLAIDLIVKTL